MGPYGLLLSARFFDKDGDLLCVIVRNEFKRDDDKSFYIDGNPHQLVVHNKQGDAVIDVEFIDLVNGPGLRVAGNFYLSNGKPFIADKSAVTVGGIKLSGNIIESGTLITYSDGGPPALGNVPWQDSQ
jgi:hypothetical protein